MPWTIRGAATPVLGSSVAVSGILAANGDTLVLPCAGMVGVSFNIVAWTPGLNQFFLIPELSVDNGSTWSPGLAFYDTNDYIQWFTGGNVDSTHLDASTIYSLDLPAHSTHVRLRAQGSGSIGSLTVNLSAGLLPLAPRASESPPNTPRPPFLSAIGARDGSNLLQSVRLGQFSAAQSVSMVLASDQPTITAKPPIVQATPLPLESGSLATRTSADIEIHGSGLILTVSLANTANAPTITPTINGKTASGAYVPLWTAAAALTGDGVAVYQLGPMAATALAGGITEGKIALIPGVVQIVLAYTGDGATDTVDTTADLDVTP